MFMEFFPNRTKAPPVLLRLKAREGPSERSSDSMRTAPKWRLMRPRRLARKKRLMVSRKQGGGQRYLWYFQLFRRTLASIFAQLTVKCSKDRHF
jgi:hypothetical protein